MDVFSALGDPIRRQLLLRLADGATRVVDLASAHPVSRPAISRHLRVLREAGLVEVTEEGRERHYALSPGPLADVRHLLDALAPPRPPISDHHLDALATEVARGGRDRRTHTPTEAHPTTQEQIA